MGSTTCRLLIVEDHTLVREALSLVLRGLGPQWEIVEAGDVATAERLLAAGPVDLVLLDLHLPDVTGNAGYHRIQSAAGEQTPVVVLSGDVDSHKIRELLDAGARGYIAKSETTGVTVSAIELVLSGGTYIPGEALDVQARTSPGLTPRQRQILALLVAGHANKEIAALLDSSVSTIRTHLAAVFRHLGVQNRTQAVRLALERRLI